MANALSNLINKEADDGRIRGVYIEETEDQYTHCQFVDDTSVLVEARRTYIDQVLYVFRLMGRASSLYIKETNVKAVYIS